MFRLMSKKHFINQTTTKPRISIVKDVLFIFVVILVFISIYSALPAKNRTDVKNNLNTIVSIIKETNKKHNIKIGDAVIKSSKPNAPFDASLSQNVKIQVDKITLNVDGTGTMYYRGKEYPIQLASIHLIPTDSYFYKANKQKITQTINHFLNPTNRKVLYEVIRLKKQSNPSYTQIYLFVNNKLYQETLLENGLAYESQKNNGDYNEILSNSQNTAINKKLNIWQMKDIINDYSYNYNNEKEYYSNPKLPKPKCSNQ